MFLPSFRPSKKDRHHRCSSRQCVAYTHPLTANVKPNQVESNGNDDEEGRTTTVVFKLLFLFTFYYQFIPERILWTLLHNIYFTSTFSGWIINIPCVAESCKISIISDKRFSIILCGWFIFRPRVSFLWSGFFNVFFNWKLVEKFDF